MTTVSRKDYSERKGDRKKDRSLSTLSLVPGLPSCGEGEGRHRCPSRPREAALFCVPMAPYSLHRAHILTSALWSKVVYYVGNRVPFGTQHTFNTWCTAKGPFNAVSDINARLVSSPSSQNEISKKHLMKLKQVDYGLHRF